MRNQENRERAALDYENMDREIEAGHLYVHLHLALACAKDEAQEGDLRTTMADLYASSGYLREVLEAYGPFRLGDALSFLSSRSSSYRHGCYSQDRIVKQSEGYLEGRICWPLPDNANCIEAIQSKV